MARYALINAQGLVENVVLWDGQTQYAPAGLTPIKSDLAALGDIFDGTTFKKPDTQGSGA